MKRQELLLAIHAATEQAGGGLTEASAQACRRRYRAVLTGGARQCPPPAPKAHAGPGRTARSKSRNLLERLRAVETETLRLMTDARVPFTHNQSANDIRMTKLQQTISGCFRSLQGAQIFGRVRSYLSTCRKHGISPTDALRTLFAGQLPDFIAKLE